MKAYIYIMAILFILALGYIIGGKYDYDKIEALLTKKEVVTKWDTTIVIKNDTLTIKKENVKTYYYNQIDTIFVTKEFEKTIDTTIDQSRIKVSYFFPQDSFKLKLNLAIKEILRTDTVKTYVTIPQYKTDYTTPVLTGIAGVGAGVVLGILITK